MKRLGELDNIQLLNDVKVDALQPIDKLIDDAGVGCLVDFAKTVWEKSIENLEYEICHYPKDIPLFVDMIVGTRYIMSEIKEEALLDILVKDYWSKDVKNKVAFDKYLTIITLMKISEGASPRQIQQILLQQLMELNEISGVGKEW
ncbi:MAG: hypothetical protein IIW54_04040 [Lachnospiraceae bacterium]|nr:hypothetical protein [Lachnospiraceae bacterium]